MYEINSIGQNKLTDLVTENNINRIVRVLINNYYWFSVEQDYSQFLNIVKEEIKELGGKGILQESCIIFHLNLFLSLGRNFMKDENYKWVSEFYLLNDYLPELDFSNKLNDHVDEYFKMVIGNNQEYLKNAILKLPLIQELSIVDIYPEKYKFLKDKGIALNDCGNLNLTHKLEFIFGVNFLKKSFFSKKIKDENDFLKKMVIYYDK